MNFSKSLKELQNIWISVRKLQGVKQELKKTGKKSRKLKKPQGNWTQGNWKKTQGNQKKTATEAQCLNEPPLCVEK